MNHIYRLIWNNQLNAWVAAPEIAKTRGKRGGGKSTGLILALGGMMVSGQSFALDPGALPSGGQISAGAGHISQAGNQMTIQQQTPRMVADWQSFNIGKNAQVDFHQPSTSSVALNRIGGQDASQIQGKLNANGQVYLLNPNGVVFGKTAQVNVGGLVASTHQISDADFKAGKLKLTSNGSNGSVENQGTINAKDGVVALIGNKVSNDGTITSPKGDVVLAAGEKVQLDFDGDGLVKLEVDGAAVNTQVKNQGLIQADGAVIMTAKAANALVTSVVNNDGIVEAQSVQHKNGRILLDGGDVTNTGTLNAHANTNKADITIKADNSISHTGTAKITEKNGNTGSITVDSGTNGITKIDGTITANSTTSKGGDITVLGKDIQLNASSQLQATGKTGGGTVLVGGDWQGSGDKHQATSVTMDKDAQIDVSATGKGDGGKAVLWSDVKNADSITSAHGSIKARAGKNGGNGGKIETSAHTVDIDNIKVNAGADNGKGGEWLVDPSDSTITAGVASSYAATLNTGTDVLNDVTGTITWGSGVALTKASGGDATLTLRSGNAAGNSNIDLSNANILSAAGALNLVLWTRYNTEAQAGRVLLGGNINTNGGHLWVGGGNQAASTWNGLTVGQGAAATFTKDESGVYVKGTINTGAGSIYMSGLSNVTANNAGINNFGVHFDTLSTTSTTAGSITLTGAVKGIYTNAGGVLIGAKPTGGTSGDLSISTGSGAINISSTGEDQTGSANNWRHGTMLLSHSAGDDVVVKTDSGNINLSGAANFGAGGDFTSDTSGLQFQTDTPTSTISVVSKTGTINLTGSNTQEAQTGENAIRFAAYNASTNNIRIGYDGTNAYSGNISINGNSLTQYVDNGGSGSIAIQSTGALAIQPTTASFTQLRKTTSLLDFNDDWNFGTTLSSFTLGSTTNTYPLTLANPLTVKGAINLKGGDLAINANLTSTGPGASSTINAQSTGDISFTNNLTLTTTGGDILLAARSAGAAAGHIKANNDLTIKTNGGNITMGGGDATASGYAIGGNSNPLRTGISMEGVSNFNTAGGNIILRGQASGYDTTGGGQSSWGVGFRYASTINSGTGTISIDGKSANPGTDDENSAVEFYSTATITSANTTADAIKIVGDATGAGSSGDNGSGINFAATHSITATGNGGGITLQGTQGGGWAIRSQYGDTLAVNGPINILGTKAGANLSMFFDTVGANNTTTNNKTSTSNVLLRFDKLTWAGTQNLNTTGTFTVEPVSNGFQTDVKVSSFAINTNNTNAANQLSAMTWGKELSPSDYSAFHVIADTALTVNGPINYWAGNVDISANNTTVGANHPINIQAKDSILFKTNSVVLTTSNSDVTLASRARGAATGNIKADANLSINTAGGNITIGGGDALASGYAIGQNANNFRMGFGVINALSLSSAGGNIVVRGQANSNDVAGTGVYEWGLGVLSTTNINAGSGTVYLDGKSNNPGSGDYNSAVELFGAATITSANTTANAIKILGDATGALGGNAYGIWFDNTANSITATGAGGGITLQGTKGGTAGQDALKYMGGNILAVSGPINLLGTAANDNATFGYGAFFLGANSAVTNNTASTSNIDIKFDTVYFFSNKPNINTTGTFTFEPISNGFQQALSFSSFAINETNTSTSNKLTAFTWGKDVGTAAYSAYANNADKALSVNGPISIYGGPVALSQNIASTNGSPILIRTSNLTTTGTPLLSSTGTLNIQPDALASTIGIGVAGTNLNLPSSLFNSNFVDGFSQINIGRAGGTGKITISSLTAKDNVNFFNTTGNIELTGYVNAQTNTLTLSTGGTITDTGLGKLTAASLLLQGGAVTLDNTLNDAGTLAANVASLTYRDANALTIGSVNGVNGLTATGMVDVSTQLSDLTLNQTISTTDTTATAVTLNAGRTNNVGSSTGGNILVTGTTSITMGTGGIAKLFTGSVLGSNGLTNLVGSGSGRFRYYSDEVATNYNTTKAPLTSGLYAIYREQPNVTVNANDVSAIYGDAPLYTSTNTGLTNGDLPTFTLTSPVYSGSNSLKTGSYTITPSGLDDLGMLLQGATANLTVTPRDISANVLVNNKIYDAGITAVIASYGSLNNAIANDVVSASFTAASFSDKNIGTNKSITFTGGSLSGADSANYNLTGGIATANITPKALTASGFTADNKTYDGNTDAVISSTPATLSGVIGSEVVTVNANAIGAFDNKNAGTGKTVSISGVALGGSDAGNYSILTTTSTTADISAKALTVSGITAANKIYDGNTNATVDTSGAALNGLLVDDDLSVNATGLFADKNVGVGKTVSLTSTYSGADKDNYSITDQATPITADITAKELSVSGITASNKIYDGNTDASLDTSHANLIGLVAGDQFSIDATGSFDSKNVGSGKTVTLSNAYSGADKDNYSITDQATPITADITAKELSVSGITASNKIYDGNTDASLDTSHANLTGLVAGDQFSIDATGSFDSKNVGSGKTVTLSNAYSGADKDNYSITDQATPITADITAKELSVSGITASNKIYDGNTDASLDTSHANLTGLVAGDQFSIDATGSFDSKNVGSGKTVTLSNAYSGADKDNYSITDQATPITADITAKELSVSGITASNKIYDGNTDASLDTSHANLIGLVAGDQFSIDATGSFDSKNVGSGKTVTLSNAYSGADKDNYSITDQATPITADITAKELSVSGITASNKIYDGNTDASLDTSHANLTGLVAGDQFSIDATGSFDSKNVGSGKTVTLSNAYSGADKDNYSITDQATPITADITAKELSVSGITASNKIYDGNTDASLDTSHANLTGLVAGDQFSIDATGSFDSKNVGSGKTVTLSNAYSGADKDNYSITDQATPITADITAKELSVSGITASNKIYDGNTDASLDTSHANLTGLVAGDQFSIDATGSFDSKNVGAGKTVTLSNAYSGADKDNYSITDQATPITADITAKELSVSGITASNKIYDGNTDASLDTSHANLIGLVAGDQFSIDATGSFDSKNVGSGKTVTLSNAYSGADKDNYSITDQATPITADITAKELSVSGITASNKIYDGNTDASLDTSHANLTGLVAGDQFSIDATGSFDSKNVGSGKTVTLSNAYSGADKDNYSITDQATPITADITAKELSVSGITASNKIYDGNTDASLDTSHANLIGLVAGDQFSIDATGSFDSKNVGSGKTVTLSNAYSGADKDNYSITDQATPITADITAKELSVSGITASNKIYDGNTDASLDTSHANLTGLVAGDQFSIDATGSFDSKNVGSGKTVTLSNAYSGADKDNYSITDQATPITADITAKELSVSGITASNKIYDGNTDASLDTSHANLIGLVAGDQFSIDATGSFDSKNVGSGKTVTLSNAYSGADKDNYSITDQATPITADITAKELSVSGITASNKIYDGNTDASLDTSHANLTGLVAGDQFSIDATGSFDSKNVGSGKTVTLSNAYSGADKDNYSITDQATPITADITAKELSVSGITASNKIYDGNTDASLDTSHANLTGLVAGDQFSIDATGSFDSKNVGAGKTVTLSNAYSGADKDNYSITDQATPITADITAKELSVSGITASNKIYDGNTDASLDTSHANLIGLVAGDQFSIDATGSFDSKNVGSGKTVTLSNAYSGADKDNYSITDQATPITADITAKELSVSGITASNKIYDGNTDASLDTSHANLTGLVAGDQFSIDATGSFDSKNVGSGKTVTLSNAYSGADKDNYSITDQATPITADITAKELSVSGITASNKIYDGNTDASLDTSHANLTGLVAGDQFSIDATGSFDSKNVGAGKTVTLSNAYSGADKDNYSITDQATPITADITAKELSVSGITASNKIYDGNTDASLDTSHANLTGLVAGDQFSIDATGSFDSKNVGSGKTVTLSNAYSGADKDNYSITDQATPITADITAKELSVSGITASNKIYDGNTDASLDTSHANLTGLVAGDQFSIDATGSFDSKNVGSGKTVTLSNAYSGADKDNYSITDQATPITADITAKELSVSGITASNKIYDGNTDASLDTSHANLTGLVAGDQFSIDATGSFDSKNVGSGKTVTLSNAYSGADKDNYSITDQATPITADITAKELSVSGITASNKIYDGNTDASLDTSHANLIGLVAGDQFSIDATGSFDSKNVGAGKTVTLSNAYSGADKDNYSITDQVDTTADISAKALTVSGITASNKVYDGNTDATLISSAAVLQGVITGDNVTVSSGSVGTFDTKDVGAGKTVSFTGLALAGTDANNYSISSSSTTTADITAFSLSLNVAKVSRVYDGTTNILPTAGASIVDLFSGDVVNLDTSSVMGVVDKNVGTNKPVTYSGFAISGAQAGNYYLPSNADSIADITRLNLVTWVGGATGNWFDPANWAGGAVPDLANVANVIIPTGTVVDFGSAVVAPALAGPVQIDSLGVSGGGLNLSAGELDVGNGGINLGSINQTGGGLDSSGPIVLDSFNQSAGSLVADSSFTVNQDFAQTGTGTVSVAGNTTITDTSGGATLGNLSAHGILSVTSTNGDISQTSGTSLEALTASIFDAGSNDVILDSNGNNFVGAVSVTANDATLADGAGGIVLGNVITDGALAITSTGGNISQTPNTTVQSTGTTALNAGTSDVLLGNAANNFGGAVSVTANDATLADNTGGITLGDVVTDGALAITSTGGNISQTPNSTVQSTGTTALNAGTSDVLLGNAANNFGGAVSVTANDATLADNTGGITLGDVVTDGALAITSTGGNISQTPNTTVQSTGTTALNAGTSDVLLGNAANNFGGAVSVTANDATLADNTGGITLGDVVTDGALAITSTGGNISQTPNTTVQSTGTTALNAGTSDVLLGNAANNFGGAVSVTANDATLADNTGGITLGDVVTDGALAITSTGGNISQTPNSTVQSTGTTALNAGTSDVLLGNAANNFGGAVSVTANDATLADNTGGITLGDVVTDGALAITSTGGNISQTPNTTVQSTGTTALNAGTSDVLLGNAANNFGGAVSVTANDATLADNTGGITLGDVVTDGALAITSTGGNISQTPNTTVQSTGTTALNAGISDVLLGNAANNFGGAVSVTANDATLADNTGGITLGDVVTDGALAITSTGGNISQTPNSTVQSTGTTALNAGTSDVLLGNAANNFGGAVSVTANDATLADNTGGITLGDVVTDGALAITSTGGNISQTPNTTVQSTGTTALNARTSDVLLGNAANNFGGAVSVTANDATLADNTGGITLGDVVTDGALAITSTGGNISQTPNSTVQSTGTTALNAGISDVLLGNAANNFGGAVSVTANDATLADNTGGITLGDVVTDGALAITSTGGNISQTPNTTVQSTGTTALNAGTSDVLLGNAANNFGGAVSVTANDASLTDATGGIILGNINTDGVLSVNSTGGDINQTNGSHINANGSSNFAANNTDGTSADINLDNGKNNFVGAVSLDGDNITLTDNAGGVLLGDVTSDGVLKVNSKGGNITQTSDSVIAASGEVKLSATNDSTPADIILPGNNDFASSVYANGANITLTDVQNGIELGNVVSTSGLIVKSKGGNITQKPETSIISNGEMTLSAAKAGLQADILLDNSDNEFAKVNVSGGIVRLTDIDGISAGTIDSSDFKSRISRNSQLENLIESIRSSTIVTNTALSTNSQATVTNASKNNSDAQISVGAGSHTVNELKDQEVIVYTK